MKKGDDEFLKQVYLVVLDRCEQSMLDTLSIADIVLAEFHKDYPNITGLRLKSDNAGTYFNLLSPFVLRVFSKYLFNALMSVCLYCICITCYFLCVYL